MWREAPYTLIPSSGLIIELAVRVILLLGVFVARWKLTPNMHYITKAELQDIYKRPHRDSYVPPWAIVILVIIVPLLFFSIPVLLTRNYMEFTQSFLSWTLALSINALITETIKLIVLRPRPDFFYRCFPTGIMTKELYCTGSYKDVVEGRKSFPSGHSSFAFCSMGFLSLWLCGRLGVLSRHRRRKVEFIILCLIPFMVASVVGMSRCWDNHHHWDDVLIGAILGLVSSYLCYAQYYNPVDSELSGYSHAVTMNHCSETSITASSTKDINIISQ